MKRTDSDSPLYVITEHTFTLESRVYTAFSIIKPLHTTLIIDTPDSGRNYST